MRTHPGLLRANGHTIFGDQAALRRSHSVDISRVIKYIILL